MSTILAVRRKNPTYQRHVRLDMMIARVGNNNVRRFMLVSDKAWRQHIAYAKISGRLMYLWFIKASAQRRIAQEALDD